MMDFEIKVSFNGDAGRYVARYAKDGISFEYVVPDWAVNRFGSEPTLVEEVSEIFSLNFLYFWRAASQQKAASAPAEVPAAA